MIKLEDVEDILKKFEVVKRSYIQNYYGANPVQRKDFSSFRFRFGNLNFIFTKSPNTGDGRVMIDKLPDEIVKSILEGKYSGIKFGEHFSEFYPNVYFENTNQVGTTAQRGVNEQFLDDPDMIFASIDKNAQKRPNSYAVAMVDNKDTLEMIMNRIKEMMPKQEVIDEEKEVFEPGFSIRRGRR